MDCTHAAQDVPARKRTDSYESSRLPSRPLVAHYPLHSTVHTDRVEAYWNSYHLLMVTPITGEIQGLRQPHSIP